MTVEEVAKQVEVSRFTYTKWEQGRLTETAATDFTRRRLIAVERALLLGLDGLLFPEPTPAIRARILAHLIGAFQSKQS